MTLKEEDRRIDAGVIAEIKGRLSLADIVREDGHELRRAGRNDEKCRCPFHTERTASCYVNATRLKCFGCGVHHDPISFWRETRGRNFPEAVEQLAARAGVILPNSADTKRTTSRTMATPTSPEPPPRRAPEKPLPPDFHETHRQIRWAAYQDTDGQSDTALKLGIRPESVRALTVPIACALRWSREPLSIANGASHSCSGRVVYCYCHGRKVRAPYGDDRNSRFPWSYGRAVHPWRACIMAAHPKIARGILFESESDLCAAFDTGWKKLNPLPGEKGRVLVAGATGFSAEWIPLFKGRRVLIAFDDDERGEQSAQKVAGMLSPVVTSVEILTLAAV